MTRRLLLLLVGTGLTSLSNFWLYVVVAASDTSGEFSLFVKANYLGGLYLFGIAGSVGIIAMYAFRSGSAKAVLRQYTVLCTMVAIPLLFGCLYTGNALGAILCVISAICMQIAGLMIAVLIEADRTVLVSLLPPMHPIIFRIALEWMPEHLSMRWIWCYLIASVLLCATFVAIGLSHLLARLRKKMTGEETSTKKVLTRMLLATSFGIVLQLDVVIAGTLRHLDLARFAILQKMYGSVATALSGATVQMVLTKTRGNRRGARNAWMLSLSVVAGIGGALVCITLSWLKPTFHLDSADFFLIPIATLLYYLSTFANTVVSIHWPRNAGVAMLAGTIAYSAALGLELGAGMVWHPVSPMVMFFLVYATVATWLARKEGFLKKDFNPT